MIAEMIHTVMEETPMIAGATNESSTRMLQTVTSTVPTRLTFLLFSMVFLPLFYFFPKAVPRDTGQPDGFQPLGCCWVMQWMLPPP